MKNNVIELSQERLEELKEKLRKNKKFEMVESSEQNKVIKVSNKEWKKYRNIVKANDRLKQFLKNFNIKADKKFDILELVESSGILVNYEDFKDTYHGGIEKTADNVNFFIEYKYSEDIAMETKVLACLVSVYCYFQKIFNIKEVDQIKKLKPKEQFTLDALNFQFYTNKSRKNIDSIYFSLNDRSFQALEQICPEIYIFAKELYKKDINVAFCENKEF